MPSSPGASRRAPPPPPRMSASSVSRPERGSTAWKTSAGNDTWLAATERSGSSSHERLDQHVGQPLDRQVARAQRRREGRLEQAALGAITRTRLVRPAFWGTAGPRKARTAK